jgi:acetyl esterase
VTLHPQARGLLDQMAAAGMPPLADQPVEEARAITPMLREMVGPGPRMFQSLQLAIPVESGELIAHAHRPCAYPAGMVVYFHGGGWVVGSSADIEATLQLLAEASGFEVVAVDYRLAPEHRFPTAAEDAYAALEWLVSNIAAGKPVVVAGDSAGGTLAALSAIRARDRSGPELAGQVLVYPVTDGRMNSASYSIYGDAGLMVGRREMEWFWNHYLPEPAGRSDPAASPLLAPDLSGLPPTLIVIAEFDPLRDEVRAYAERLREAGVDIRIDEYADMFHGFATMPNILERGNEALGRIGDFVRDRSPARSGAHSDRA